MKTVRDERALEQGASERDLGPVEDVTAGTREKVARAILENGRTTAADLAQQLELTPAAVRRHLDALLADGLITEAEQRGQAHRGRGRPAKVFVVTDTGRHHFVQAYDDLATSALRFLAETAGPHAVEAFANRRIAEIEERYRPQLAAVAPADRAAVLAEALSADGYAASVRPAPGGAVGEQVCQHHCPVAHVAEQFPQLCEAETAAFGRLLGTHVQRLATIAHGDGVCTTFVPTGATTGRTTS